MTILKELFCEIKFFLSNDHPNRTLASSKFCLKFVCTFRGLKRLCIEPDRKGAGRVRTKNTENTGLQSKMSVFSVLFFSSPIFPE